MFKPRQTELLRRLKKEERFCPADELAKQLGCSVKTVYGDIAVLRQYLAQNEWGALITKPHCGVRLLLTEKGLSSLEWDIIAGAGPTESELATQGELFLLLRCLLRRRTVTTDELGKLLHGSRSLVERRLEQARPWLEGAGLALMRQRGKGNCVAGDELHFRFAEWRLFQMRCNRKAKNGGTQGTDMIRLIREQLDGFDAAPAARVLQTAEQKLKIRFSYDTYVRLLFWCSLTVWWERYGAPQTIPREIPLSTTLEKQLFDRLQRGLQREYCCEIGASGQMFLRLGVLSAEVIRFESESQRLQFLAQNSRLCGFVSWLLEMTGRVLQVDFSGDEVLELQLFWAFRCITAWSAWGFHPEYPFLARGTETEKAVGAAVALVDGLCQSEYGTELTPRELLYFSAALSAAVKRDRSVCRLALVCTHGIGVTQILREEIESRVLGARVCRVLSVRELERQNLADCDLLVSVVPLPYHPQGIEVIYVDQERFDPTPLQRKIDRLCGKRGIRRFADGEACSLFSGQAILLDCRIRNKERLLDALCARLEERGAVKPAYRDSMWRREQASSTMLGGGLALPHGRTDDVIDSAIALAVMHSPLSWGETSEAQFVMLAAFRMDQNGAQDAILRFYKWAARVSRGDERHVLDALRGMREPAQAAKLLNEALRGDVYAKG